MANIEIIETSVSRVENVPFGIVAKVFESQHIRTDVDPNIERQIGEYGLTDIPHVLFPEKTKVPKTELDTYDHRPTMEASGLKVTATDGSTHDVFTGKDVSWLKASLFLDGSVVEARQNDQGDRDSDGWNLTVEVPVIGGVPQESAFLEGLHRAVRLLKSV